MKKKNYKEFILLNRIIEVMREFKDEFKNEEMMKVINEDIERIMEIAEGFKDIDYGIYLFRKKGKDFEEGILTGREFYEIFIREFNKLMKRFKKNL